MIKRLLPLAVLPLVAVAGHAFAAEPLVGKWYDPVNNPIKCGEGVVPEIRFTGGTGPTAITLKVGTKTTTQTYTPKTPTKDDPTPEGKLKSDYSELGCQGDLKFEAAARYTPSGPSLSPGPVLIAKRSYEPKLLTYAPVVIGVGAGNTGVATGTITAPCGGTLSLTVTCAGDPSKVCAGSWTMFDGATQSQFWNNVLQGGGTKTITIDKLSCDKVPVVKYTPAAGNQVLPLPQSITY